MSKKLTQADIEAAQDFDVPSVEMTATAPQAQSTAPDQPKHEKAKPVDTLNLSEALSELTFLDNSAPGIHTPRAVQHAHALRRAEVGRRAHALQQGPSAPKIEANEMAAQRTQSARAHQHRVSLVEKLRAVARG